MLVSINGPIEQEQTDISGIAATTQQSSTLMRGTKSSMNKTVIAAKLGRGDRNRSEPVTSHSGVPSMPPVKKQLFNNRSSAMGEDPEQQRKRSPGKKKDKLLNNASNAQNAYQTLQMKAAAVLKANRKSVRQQAQSVRQQIN